VLTQSTIRLFGLAAIVAGILRGLTSLIPGTTPHVMLLYLVVDVFLLFGSIGLYRFQREENRWPETLGFLLQMVGVLILIGRDVAIFGAGIYPVGALMFAVGLDLVAVSSWRAKKFPRWILLFLIASTIVGPIGFFARGLGVLFVVSGIVFGIGFAGAGAQILFSRRELFQPAGSEHG
jgi:multisubunit Na+/H+ antiporter MnhG subunit